MEKPAVTATPTPQPVTTIPVHDEKKRETAIEKKNTPTPPAVETKPRYEARPEMKRETKPPVKIETAPPTIVRKPVAPPAEGPAQKRLLSPKEKSSAAEGVDAKKPKKKDEGPKKKGED